MSINDDHIATNTINIARWIDSAKNPIEKRFRQAVHILLLAIAGADALRQKMIVKGGILLAIRHQSTRNTRDIDFSTSCTHRELDINKFLTELNSRLIITSQRMDYDIDCRVQSHELNPPEKKEPAFPTLRIKVGFALRSTEMHRKLMKKQCIDVVRIDFSFNEQCTTPEIINIAENSFIKVYSLVDLVAEKYRAMLQQPDRNRYRRQDVYDLFILITKYDVLKILETKKKIMESLSLKCKSRDVLFSFDSLQNPEIYRRSLKEYENLKDEIQKPLPPFDSAYHIVRDYYENLPWK